ncbi:MAG TPA: DUF4142 domain-containing protein [Burkholderiales bacterium]
MNKTLMFLPALGLTAVFACAAPPARAELFDQDASVAPGAAIASSDVRWMEKAVRAQAAQVEAGKLAQAQGQSGQVRDLGGKLAAANARLSEELTALATRKQVVLPNQPDAAHRDELRKLAGMRAADFDREYFNSSGLKDNEETAKLCADGIDDLKDADLKAYAARTLAALKRQHALLRAVVVVQQ